MQPSVEPSKQPSTEPSTEPSAEPSKQPSAEPSKQPSTEPSAEPSKQPSAEPSKQPSVEPSAEPSKQPSTEPSAEPSKQPSTEPSTEPSVEPSKQPSVEPSMEPSAEPSKQPSNEPSREPSRTPSTEPSAQPSREPSVEPSPAPTLQCTVAAQCPTNTSVGAGKCAGAACINGTCVFETIVCTPPPLAAGSDAACWTSTCQPDTGLCVYARNHTCCSGNETASLAHCYDSGRACHHVACVDVNVETGLGRCGVVRSNDSACCETNAECELDGDLCTRATCDHRTDRCIEPEYAIVCPNIDSDECTQPMCNSSTGQCTKVRRAHAMKCAGACCVHFTDNGTMGCAYLNYFDCVAYAGGVGTWINSNSTCDTYECFIDNGAVTDSSSSGDDDTMLNDGPLSHQPLVAVEPWYASYARTLCRVLNTCGDGDEPLCASPSLMSDEQLLECQRLGCCAVEGVPAEFDNDDVLDRRKRRHRQQSIKV